jgi:hypothetical protein
MYYTNVKNYSSLKESRDDYSGLMIFVLAGLLAVIIYICVGLVEMDRAPSVAVAQQNQIVAMLDR